MAVGRRPRWLALRLRRLQDRLGARLAARLRRFFAGQAARVVARHGAGITLLVPPEEVWALYRALEPGLRAAVVAAAELTAPAAGSSPLVEADWRVQALLAEAGTRVVAITTETRRAVQATLVQGAERHYSPWQIANGVPGDGFRGLRDVVRETYRGRADVIAATEIAMAAAASAADRYGDAGVTEVDILDGPECGWRFHLDSDKANGTRRMLWDYRQHLLSHPNCARVAIPVLESRR